ncbi:MAG: hypothetical protein ACM3XN_01915 [Chloroflexota bacterium]
MRNERALSSLPRPVAVVVIGMLLSAALTAAALAGCSRQPAQLRIISAIGARDTDFIDRPLAVASTREGAMLLAMRADGQVELVRLDAARAVAASSPLAGQFSGSPHEFGLLPDSSLAVRTRADRVQLFAREDSGAYVVSSTLPAGGPLAVGQDGYLYVSVGNTIRRYAADGKLGANWTAPAAPLALAWNPNNGRICAFLGAAGPEQLRLTQRSAIYAAPSYGAERLGALERGAVVSVQDGSAAMNGFVRITTPVAGFVPTAVADSVIGTLCQYTPTGGAGSLQTVSCDYAPRCTANRRVAAMAVSRDGLVFLLVREAATGGDRFVLVAVDEAGFGHTRGSTPATRSPSRRPLRAAIPDVDACGLACYGDEVLVVDGRQLWRGPVWGSGLMAVDAAPPAPGTFREPLALAVDPNRPDCVAVLDWLRGDTQVWSGGSVAEVRQVPLAAGEMAIDVLADNSGETWVATLGPRAARIIALAAGVDYCVPPSLSEALAYTAWWIEPGTGADYGGTPLIHAGWGERTLTYAGGGWTVDSGGHAYPWQHYLPDSTADIEAQLRRAGVLPREPNGSPPDWTRLIRGMTTDAHGRFYLVTGRMSAFARRVVVFTADGQLEAQYRLPPEVGLPSDMAVDHDGHIWLTDPEHYRVVELAAEGESK